jgi:hypothetical protein
MRERPALHGRDHGPGGADPTLFLWDDVGTTGTGSSPRLTPFFDQLLTANAAIVTVTPLPTDCNNLIIYASLRSTDTAPFDEAVLRFNGDAGANYTRMDTSFTGTTSDPQLAVNQTHGEFGIPAANSTATFFGGATITLLNYLSGFAKIAMIDSYYLKIQTGLEAVREVNSVGWTQTPALTSVSLAAFTGNLVAGSRVTAYALA